MHHNSCTYFNMNCGYQFTFNIYVELCVEEEFGKQHCTKHWRKQFVYSLGLLQLFSPLDGVSLVLGSPLSHLRVCLGHASLKFRFGLQFLLILLPQQVRVMASRLQCMGQRVLGLEK